MSAWATVDAWRLAAETHRQAYEPWVPFAVVVGRRRSDSDRRFLAQPHGDMVRAVRRRAYGVRSRGWRTTGDEVPVRWLQERPGETWHGVPVSVLLVALDAWREAGCPRRQWRTLTASADSTPAPGRPPTPR